MKSVLHLITTIERGGAEKQLEILISKQIELGYSVDVLYLKGKPELKIRIEALGAQVISDFAEKSFVYQLLKFRQLIGRRYQIIHSHLPRAEILASFGWGRSKIIATKHNAEPFIPGRLPTISIILARVMFLMAHKTICISYAVQEYLVKIHELPSDSKKISVIHYGWPEFSFENSTKHHYPPYEVDSLIILGTIARLAPQKDLPTLLRSFAKFLEIHPHATLEVVGAGPEERELESISKSLGILERVRFLGRIENVFIKLAEWNIFVLTSKYEGFGMVLLEAMQMKLPIVAPNNSSIPEVLGSDYPWLFATGQVDDLTFKLNSICLNALNFNFENYSKAQLRKFSVEKMALAIDNLYFGDNAH